MLQQVLEIGKKGRLRHQCWIDLLDIRMVIVPTPRRAQATKMDRPAGVLGAKSPATSTMNFSNEWCEIEEDVSTITNSSEGSKTCPPELIS